MIITYEGANEASRKVDIPMQTTEKFDMLSEELDTEKETQNIIDEMVQLEYEKKVVDAVCYCYDEAKKEKAPYDKLVTQVLDNYNNKYQHYMVNLSEEWQSNIKFPKVTMAAQRLASIFTRILTLARAEWFSLYSYNSALTPLFSIFKEMLQEQFNHPKVKFFDTFSKAILGALLGLNMSVLVSWDVSSLEPDVSGVENIEDYNINPFGVGVAETKKVSSFPNSTLKITWQNPRNLYLDPTNRDRFKIRTYRYTKGEFKAEADKRGWRNVDLVLSMSGSSVYEDNYEPQDKTMSSSAMIENDTILIVEFWKDLYDKDGNLIKDNFYGVVANEKYLVYDSIIPFAHGEVPIVSCGLLDNPFSPYSHSHISISVDVYETWVKFLNILFDFYRVRVMGVNECNEDVLAPDEDLEKGLYPGKIIKKRGAEPALSALNLGDAPATMFNFIQVLDTETQESSGLSEASQTKVRAKMTAAEYTRRISDSGAFFDYTFKNIETKFLEPILRQSFLNMLQYISDEDWRGWIDNKISRIVEKEVSTLNKNVAQFAQQQMQQSQMQPPQPMIDPNTGQPMIDPNTGQPMIQQPQPQMMQPPPPEQTNPLISLLQAVKELNSEERLELFGKDIYFKTEVFSAIFDKQAELEKASYFMQTVGAIPQAAAAVNWQRLVGKVISTLGYAEDDLLVSDADYVENLTRMQGLGLMENYPSGQEVQTELPPANATMGVAKANFGQGSPLGMSEMMNIPNMPM